MNAGKLRGLTMKVMPTSEVVFLLPDGREVVIDNAQAIEPIRTGVKTGRMRLNGMPRLVVKLKDAPTPTAAA